MKTLAMSLILLMTVFVGLGSAAMIPDTYLHPLDRNLEDLGVDLIGINPPFEIYGHEWLSNGAELRIYTNWNLGLDGQSINGTKLGDVFLYTSKGTFAVALRDHDNYENDGVKKGWIFTPTQTRTSDYYFDPIIGVKYKATYWEYGDNEIVTASGNQVGTVKDLFMTAYDPDLKQSIIVIGFTEDMEGGLRFTQLCGNDVIEVIATPEPTTMLLLGSGLIGLAGLRKKLKNK